MSNSLESHLSELIAGLGLEGAVSESSMAALASLVRALEAAPAPPTRLTSKAEIARGHIADSLTALAVPEIGAATSMADIGSGAGFPGLALAAALPGARVDLIEATAKKCELIESLASQAGLGNATAVAERVETWAGGAGSAAYDVATARAVASLPILVEYAAPLLKAGGTFVAWKGVRDEAEETAGDEAAAMVGLGPAEVVAVTPFEGAHSRHLHVFRKVGETPERYPRRPGIASKRPLA